MHVYKIFISSSYHACKSVQKENERKVYISLSIWCTREIAQYYTIGKSYAHHNSFKLAGKKLRIELWFDGWPISTIHAISIDLSSMYS